MQLAQKIAQYAYMYHGDYFQIAKAIAQNQPIGVQPIHESYITRFDPQYPKALLDLPYPPWILFYQGNLSLLQRPKVAIVGSRDPLPYSQAMTKQVIEQLCPHYVIVSGLAKGIDGIAHQYAMDLGQTIGVIGSGLKYQYPNEHQYLYQQMRSHHLIISEYPFDTPVQKYHFPWRNRIIAGLSKAVMIMQAKMPSGTLITAKYAQEIGREVYCLPYQMNQLEGYGCHVLIEEGAHILYSMDQLKENLILNQNVLKCRYNEE